MSDASVLLFGDDDYDDNHADNYPPGQHIDDDNDYDDCNDDSDDNHADNSSPLSTLQPGQPPPSHPQAMSSEASLGP